ncbi:MAG: His-Xaa-Ser system protein HxsD [Clostridia bacterium]|nr:His-Xaa-Ser system protein HxsD [Clostridia bacterium]
MKIKLSKEMYEKEAIIKASYFFTDRFYMELDADDAYFYVDMVSKDGVDTGDDKEFLNEVLVQTTRLSISRQTKNIREMIIGRALASTIVDRKDTGFVDDADINADDILNNWFDTHE